MKVIFCTLYMGDKPTEPFRRSLENCLPAIEEEGWEHSVVVEQNCPYISAARAKTLKKAYDAESDYIVFLDYDVSWTPEAMVKFLSIEDDVVSGTYRFKEYNEKYMGSLVVGPDGNIIVREDGCIKADKVPAGFLKLSRKAVDKFAIAYPELLFGSPMSPALDMFNHGTIDNIWHGEDYAFSKRWNEKCGDIWLVPDLDISHHRGDIEFKGNFHKYLKAYNKPVPIDSNPLVSIIIPAYNYAEYIGDAIESALSQTYDNIEVIVVDDGSTDDTAKVVKRYPVKYIRQTNRGSSAARNTGIRHSRGEWLMCLDADDKIKPTYVERCLQIQDADIISSAMQKFGLEKSIHTFVAMPTHFDFRIANQIHCASLFRREVWEKTGGFDEVMHSVYDDWEFWVHATLLGFEVKTIPQPLFMYRKHGISMIDKAKYRHNELYNYMANKHGFTGVTNGKSTQEDVRTD